MEKGTYMGCNDDLVEVGLVEEGGEEGSRARQASNQGGVGGIAITIVGKDWS